MTDDGLAVHLHAPVASVTPWRTGGIAPAIVTAHTVDGLITALRDCRVARCPVMVLGAGTRVVFRDGDVREVVVRLGGELATIDVDDDILRCGAGAPVPAVVATAAAHGLAGVEARACTAGTLGASVLFDDGWAEHVVSVETIKRDKLVVSDLDAVRRSKRAVVVSVTLRLRRDRSEAVRSRTDAAWRSQAPAAAGSWYAPLRKGSARSVLRSVQLPLVRLRRCAIPETAPECLVNLGGGTAADLALLQRSAVDRVKKVRGIVLEPRLKWVGAR